MTELLDLTAVAQGVQARIDETMAHQRQVLAELGDVEDLVRPVESLLRGGKRLRPAFLHCGYRLLGAPDSVELSRFATSVEFFQAAALIHDDVMDGSDTRRGRPAAHRYVAARHTERGWRGDADSFGEATAILAGNLCLNWSEELFATSGLPDEQVRRARPLFDRMRTQLMGGQFLDLLESVRGWESLGTDERLASARQVIRYKSAKYSIEHPLLIGALAAGVPEASRTPLSAFGLALGEAFQLRDDVLGVFGNPATTGKPAGDDLREGKHTVLIALALDGLASRDATHLLERIGDEHLGDDEIETLRGMLVTSGATDRIEGLIDELVDQAREHLATAAAAAPLDPMAVATLGSLVDATTARSH